VIITESSLREQLRTPTMGATVAVPPGATLSPSAQDFVAQWKLQLEETGPGGGSAARGPTWDRPAGFPVVRGEQVPVCVTCGSEVVTKPDHLTQLDAYHFAPKTTPRIRLRGRLDTLHAQVLLAAARARDLEEAPVADALSTVAAYCRELVSAEYHERTVAPLELDGRDEAALRAATHAPESELGVAHVTPAADDPELLHVLNLLRCQTREVEIAALDAFPSPHHPYGASITHALNRLSSAIYYLELRFVADRTVV
jgi:ethanolamine utilization cobalamin adenosyltransferase